jgi:hypothetical protein
VRFEDAVRLLGNSQSKAVKALDYLLGGVLAVGAPFTGGATIGLFDPKRPGPGAGRRAAPVVGAGSGNAEPAAR